jgi:PAS domain S-box-containing protein
MDRTRLAHEVRISKIDLEDFFENAVVAMHLIGSDGSILRANRAELALLGYEDTEYVGHNIAKFHADANTIEDILARLSRGEKLDKYPARLRAKDGGIKHVLISSSVQFRDGQFVNTRCVSLDLTGAHAAEVESRRVQRELRQVQRQLASELAATQLLQTISTELIPASSVDALYERILHAAAAIMRSEFASMQMFYPECGELRLLAYRGFTPTAAAFWEWVRPASGSTCGVALATGERLIVPDIELCDFMAGTDNLETYRQTGIRAVQSTPLVSRAGQVMGMISTHWRDPHQPLKRDLRLLDVLARQAADLIERTKSELASHRLAAIVDSSHVAIVSKDLNGLITSWNRAAEGLFGYPAGEIIGRPIATLIPLDRQHEETIILERIRRGELVDHYETIGQRKDGSLVDIASTVSPVKDPTGKIMGASKIAYDISDKKQAQARQELLTREIEHRTRNLFAVVLSVVSRSFAGKHSVKDAETAVVSRLSSLGQTHFMLIDKEWQGADLAEIVHSELSPYSGRVQVDGPSMMLTANAAQNFALALHELATNAAKYGALSNATGRVNISWSTLIRNGSHSFAFRWEEQGGPPVRPPTRRGFGSVVLEEAMAAHFDVPPRINFSITGVTYELSGPLDAITTEWEQGSQLHS